MEKTTAMSETMELKRGAKGESLFGSLAKFATSSVGSKVLMALTGIFLWVFILGHLAGNLTMYGGAELFNAYAAKLHHTPVLVWTVRLAMLVGFPLHIYTAIRTARMNDAARPVPYAYKNKSPARLAAKSMLLSGGIVLAFFAYHIAHFTLRLPAMGPQPSSLLPDGDYDAYAMVVMGFQNPLISGFYILGQFFLAAHLSHGIYSLFQHLGLWGAKWTPWLMKASLVVGYGLCAAFTSIPLAVLLGVITP